MSVISSVPMACQLLCTEVQAVWSEHSELSLSRAKAGWVILKDALEGLKEVSDAFPPLKTAVSAILVASKRVEVCFILMLNVSFTSQLASTDGQQEQRQV